MKKQWRMVRATVEVAVLSPDWCPYTDKDLCNDVLHLVGGSQLNQRNSRLNYKVTFGKVQVKQAKLMVDKLKRELARSAEVRAAELQERAKELRR